MKSKALLGRVARSVSLGVSFEGLEDRRLMAYSVEFLQGANARTHSISRAATVAGSYTQDDQPTAAVWGYNDDSPAYGGQHYYPPTGVDVGFEAIDATENADYVVGNDRVTDSDTGDQSTQPIIETPSGRFNLAADNDYNGGVMVALNEHGSSVGNLDLFDFPSNNYIARVGFVADSSGHVTTLPKPTATTSYVSALDINDNGQVLAYAHDVETGGDDNSATYLYQNGVYRKLTLPGGGELDGIALNEKGDVLLADPNTGNLYSWSSAGNGSLTPRGGGIQATDISDDGFIIGYDSVGEALLNTGGTNFITIDSLINDPNV